MTRFLSLTAIGVLLGMGVPSTGSVHAQGTVPDVERRHEQHERDVQERQQRRAQHREQMKEHSERHEQRLEDHGEKLKRKNGLSAEDSNAARRQQLLPNQKQQPPAKP